MHYEQPPVLLRAAYFHPETTPDSILELDTMQAFLGKIIGSGSSFDFARVVLYVP